MNIVITAIIAGGITALICPFGYSICELALHKFIMHRPLKIFGWEFRYPFEKHAVVHHGLFKSDKTFHHDPSIPENIKTIPMAWWNGIVLVSLITQPVNLLAYYFAGHWVTGLAITVVTFVAGMCYYGVYEYIHWCMHLPKPAQRRLLEQSWVFYRLKGHHLLHHRHMNTNFNVVFPFADWLFGTLTLITVRSYVRELSNTRFLVQEYTLRTKLNRSIDRYFQRFLRYMYPQTALSH
ncbi:MAG: hypothetical protein RIT04_92 [Candidatus Parcubacteria bacterium]|jgi:hypothetical protein